jgi:hypothetical protein
MTSSKRDFSAESLQALFDKLHKNPELLKGDWRNIVKEHFHVSPEDEKTLTGLSKEKIKHIQDYLERAGEHIRKGGKVTAKLVKRPPHEQSDMVYDIDVDFKPKGDR